MSVQSKMNPFDRTRPRTDSAANADRSAFERRRDGSAQGSSLSRRTAASTERWIAAADGAAKRGPKAPRGLASYACHLLAGLLVSLCLSAAPAQAQAVYGARLSTGLARLGEEMYLLIEVESDQPPYVRELPEVPGIEFGNIPNASSRTTRIQIGPRVSLKTTTSWKIRVTPLEVGDFLIPGIKLIVEGQEVVTEELGLKVVKDLRGAELGFLDFKLSKTDLVEGQPFELEMTFGWDSAKQAEVNYANLILPWWGRLRGLLELENASQTMSSDLLQLQLNGNDRIRVERIQPVTRDSRTFFTCRLVRSFLPVRSGRIELPDSHLEFGEVIESGGFFSRSSRKAQTYFVTAPAVTINVRPLPDEGRPIDYTGAIGNLTARARTEMRDVDVGDSIKLKITWFGEGNLEFFEAPDLSRDPNFKDFKVFGSAAGEKSRERRSVTYDIAPLRADVDEVPPVRLPIFDPDTNKYTEVVTEAIPIRVRALEGAVDLSVEDGGPGLSEDIRDIDTSSLGSAAQGELRVPGRSVLAGSLLLVTGLWLVLRSAIRRSQGDPSAPLERRRRRAFKSLQKDLRQAERSDDPSAYLKALHRFLAACSREADWAWVGRDVEQHLESRGGSRELGRELATAIESLECGAYSKAERNGSPVSSGELLKLADKLSKGALA